jgi:hypothetical protein
MRSSSKNKAFDVKHSEFAHYCRALAHPARFAIIAEIVLRGGQIKGDAIEIPSMANATVLQHLRELKRSGIISGRIFGSRSDFKINSKALSKFEDMCLKFFEENKAVVASKIFPDDKSSHLEEV